jgi:hypothetical protein
MVASKSGFRYIIDKLSGEKIVVLSVGVNLILYSE